ncbi:hypothetical protein [Xanthomonas arboricola]|uniref:hypothetical protein n=1 Tax=Xanthomonas arboricola TaxID=56448 RepID=UPI00141AB6CC|nr:hypothetical protein [Xanthomonas arboricola]NIK44720.1 hypothetical protein [Xanthomonas arboricola]
MDTWQPITVEELKALIAEQLIECSTDQHEIFERSKVTPYLASIARLGNTETVFVVAKVGDVILYYEDVEEGFNISRLSPDGAIATPRCEQWELCHALVHLAAAKNSLKPTPIPGAA